MKVSLEKKSAAVLCDPDVTKPEALLAAVKDAGFEAKLE